MRLGQLVERKTFEVPQQDQPHSALVGGPHPLSFFKLDVGFEASILPLLFWYVGPGFQRQLIALILVISTSLVTGFDFEHDSL